MLKIRLTRRGKRNRPFFRIVVAEASAPIKGRFIEILGFLDPIKKKIGLKKERIKYWLEKGAKPSDTVHNLLVSEAVIKAPKINKFAKKKGKEQKQEKPEAIKPKPEPEEKEEKKEEKK